MLQRFSAQEVRELVISCLALALMFTYAFGGGLAGFPIILFTLGLAFIGHELAHKFTAQNYGFLARYKMDPNSLLFAFFLAVMTKMGGFPIIFAAPGAVLIHPLNKFGQTASPGQAGRISIAGAMANLAFAALFALVALFSSGALNGLAMVGLWVNGFLALFNLLPFGRLDGKKVFRWNPRIWLFTLLLALLALRLAY